MASEHLPQPRGRPGLAIVILLAIVVASYRQICFAYPNGGGAYVVRRDIPGKADLDAASALPVDYVLTVAVPVVAGVDAVISYAPGADQHAVALRSAASGCSRWPTPVRSRNPTAASPCRSPDLFALHGGDTVDRAVPAPAGCPGSGPPAGFGPPLAHRPASPRTQTRSPGPGRPPGSRKPQAHTQPTPPNMNDPRPSAKDPG